MNRSAKRKIANKLLPNRWNKLRTDHYFIDGGAKSAAKKIVKGEPSMHEKK